MRAVIVAVVGLCAACHDTDRAKQPIAVVAPPPAPKPIETCERYAAALAKAEAFDVDPEVQELFRDEAAFVRSATRAPRDADRAELTARCAHGLLDLGRVPTNDSYGVGGIGTQGLASGVAGALAGGASGGSGTGTSAATGPNCRRLFANFDRVDGCTDIPDAARDAFRQQRSLMLDAWRQFPNDPDVQKSTEDACRIAGDSLTAILSQYHCP
jgi:hypothetical protein